LTKTSTSPLANALRIAARSRFGKLAVHGGGIDAGRSEACGHRIAVRHVRGEHEGRPALGEGDVPGRIADDTVAFRRVDRPGERSLVVITFSVCDGVRTASRSASPRQRNPRRGTRLN